MPAKKQLASAFGAWFEKQYGPEPHEAISLADLEDAVRSARRHLSVVEANCATRIDWLDKRNAALSGWCAGEAALAEEGK